MKTSTSVTAELISVNLKTLLALMVTTLGQGILELIGALSLIVLILYNGMKFLNEFQKWADAKRRRNKPKS